MNRLHEIRFLQNQSTSGEVHAGCGSELLGVQGGDKHELRPEGSGTLCPGVAEPMHCDLIEASNTKPRKRDVAMHASAVQPVVPRDRRGRFFGVERQLDDSRTPNAWGGVNSCAWTRKINGQTSTTPLASGPRHATGRIGRDEHQAAPSSVPWGEPACEPREWKQVKTVDGIEPPTPAFSGLLIDKAKWFGINVSA